MGLDWATRDKGLWLVVAGVLIGALTAWLSQRKKS